MNAPVPLDSDKIRRTEALTTDSQSAASLGNSENLSPAHLWLPELLILRAVVTRLPGRGLQQRPEQRKTWVLCNRSLLTVTNSVGEKITLGKKKKSRGGNWSQCRSMAEAGSRERQHCLTHQRHTEGKKSRKEYWKPGKKSPMEDGHPELPPLLPRWIRHYISYLIPNTLCPSSMTQEMPRVISPQADWDGLMTQWPCSYAS